MIMIHDLNVNRRHESSVNNGNLCVLYPSGVIVGSLILIYHDNPHSRGERTAVNSPVSALDFVTPKGEKGKRKGQGCLPPKKQLNLRGSFLNQLAVVFIDADDDRKVTPVERLSLHARQPDLGYAEVIESKAPRPKRLCQQVPVEHGSSQGGLGVPSVCVPTFPLRDGRESQEPESDDVGALDLDDGRWRRACVRGRAVVRPASRGQRSPRSHGASLRKPSLKIFVGDHCRPLRERRRRSGVVVKRKVQR